MAELPISTSNAAAFDDRKRYATIENFKIGGRYDLDAPESFAFGAPGGTSLEDLGLDPVVLGYVELGTKHYDEQGEVDNAMLVCPYYSGDPTGYMDFWHVDGARCDFSEGPCIGPGKLFDTEKDYVVLVDALGMWGASKPSDSHPDRAGGEALGLAFPQYRLEDCVQLQYRLLVDHLGVKKLKLVTGVSYGASLAYGWGIMHPDMMERILPIGGTPVQSRGMARWLFDLMSSAIQSDPIYGMTGGDYYHLPRLQRPILGNLFGWSIIRQSGFQDELRIDMSPEAYGAEAFDWEKSRAVIDSLGSEGHGRSLFSVALIDSNDLIFRNRAQAMWDVEGELGRIRARTMIVHVETDQWLYQHIARRAHERIEGSSLLTFPHGMGHYAVFAAPNRFEKEIRAFLA